MKKITYLSLFLALIISCGRPEPPEEQTHTFEIVFNTNSKNIILLPLL